MSTPPDGGIRRRRGRAAPVERDGELSRPRTEAEQAGASRLRDQLTGLLAGEAIATAMGIRDWTHLLIGDGSGTQAHLPCGFASVLIDRQSTGDPRVFHGSLSAGSNITAELLAYLSPLIALSHERSETTRRVHIVTDCEFVAKSAVRVDWRRKHAAIWAALGAASRGMVVRWHWAPRDRLVPNKLCHLLGNLARKAAIPLVGQALEKIPLGHPE